MKDPHQDLRLVVAGQSLIKHDPHGFPAEELGNVKKLILSADVDRLHASSIALPVIPSLDVARLFPPTLA